MANSNQNSIEKIHINWWFIASLLPLIIYGLSVLFGQFSSELNSTRTILYPLLIYRYSPLWFYIEIVVIIGWVISIVMERRRGKVVGFGTIIPTCIIAVLFFSSQMCAGFTNGDLHHLQTLSLETRTFHLTSERGNFDSFFDADILIFRCGRLGLLCQLDFRASAVAATDYYLQYDETLQSITLMQRNQPNPLWIDSE